jgi:hypothetical protein
LLVRQDHNLARSSPERFIWTEQGSGMPRSVFSALG